MFSLEARRLGGALERPTEWQVRLFRLGLQLVAFLTLLVVLGTVYVVWRASTAGMRVYRRLLLNELCASLCMDLALSGAQPVFLFPSMCMYTLGFPR